MSEEAEARSSLPPLCRPGSSGGPFVLFRHPVRQLPDLLAALERPAPAVAPEDLDSRRRRLRWQLLPGLFLAAVVFFVLDSTGFQAGLFSRYVPLLCLAAVLVVAATSPTLPASPAGTPDAAEANNPMQRGFRLFLKLSALAVLLGLAAVWFRPAAVLYALLGPLTLFLLVRQAGQAASAPRRPASQPASAPALAAVTPPNAAQLAALQACREVLEAIADHAPRGAEATGWLDLTQAEPRPGRPVPHVWWRLRLPWGEGVRLRLAGLDGNDGVCLRVNLAVSPRLWLTEPGVSRHATFGLLTVDSFAVTPSRISTGVLSAQRAFRPYDVIELLKSLEERLQPRPLDTPPADSPADPPAGPAGDPA